MPVNPFLSDGQIIASFTKLEKRFHDWYVKNEAKMEAMADESDGDGYPVERKFADAAWPAPEIRRQYHDWESQWVGRVGRRMMREIPVRILQQDCEDSVWESCGETRLPTMEMLRTPFCLLGEAKFGGVFTGYGLDPSPMYLSPNFESPLDPMLLSENILGVNNTIKIKGNLISQGSQALPATGQVSPRKRGRRGEREDDSSGADTVRSAESTDGNAGCGFMFVQLGSLVAYTGDWTKVREMKREEILKGPWTATGFGVVLQINSLGYPGPVWVIYNFHDQNDDGKRCHLPMRPGLGSPVFPQIGRLTEGCKETFTYAKIANKLGDLRQGAKFKFQVEHRDELQIVRVKQFTGTDGMPLVRQFITTDF